MIDQSMIQPETKPRFSLTCFSREIQQKSNGVITDCLIKETLGKRRHLTIDLLKEGQEFSVCYVFHGARARVRIRQSVMEPSTTFYISPQKHQTNTYSVNRFIASSTLLSGTAKFIRMEQGPWKGRPSCQVTPTSQPACRT